MAGGREPLPPWAVADPAVGLVEAWETCCLDPLAALALGEVRVGDAAVALRAAWR